MAGRKRWIGGLRRRSPRRVGGRDRDGLPWLSVDYYHQPGLTLNPGFLQLGAGMGVCRQTMFDDAVLEVHDDGVRAAASFTDANGRRIDVRIDDRDGRRKTGSFLAPVSDAIAKPTSMLLVWLPRFDLVHTGGTAHARIDGLDLNIAAIPGERLWRRRLVKYGAPVETLQLFPSAADDDGAGGVGENAVEPRLSFDPLLPDLNTLSEGEQRQGSWSVATVASRLTGGTWFAHAPQAASTSAWTSPSAGNPGRYRCSCGSSPPSSRCSGAGHRPTGGAQPSTPTAPTPPPGPVPALPAPILIARRPAPRTSGAALTRTVEPLMGGTCQCANQVVFKADALSLP